MAEGMSQPCMEGSMRSIILREQLRLRQLGQGPIVIPNSPFIPSPTSPSSSPSSSPSHSTSSSSLYPWDSSPMMSSTKEIESANAFTELHSGMAPADTSTPLDSPRDEVCSSSSDESEDWEAFASTKPSKGKRYVYRSSTSSTKAPSQRKSLTDDPENNTKLTHTKSPNSTKSHSKRQIKRIVATLEFSLKRCAKRARKRRQEEQCLESSCEGFTDHSWISLLDLSTDVQWVKRFQSELGSLRTFVSVYHAECATVMEIVEQQTEEFSSSSRLFVRHLLSNDYSSSDSSSDAIEEESVAKKTTLIKKRRLQPSSDLGQGVAHEYPAIDTGMRSLVETSLKIDTVATVSTETTQGFYDEEGNFYYCEPEVPSAPDSSTEVDGGFYDDDGNYFYLEPPAEESVPLITKTENGPVGTADPLQEGFFDDDGNYFFYETEPQEHATADSVTVSESHGNGYYDEEGNYFYFEDDDTCACETISDIAHNTDKNNVTTREIDGTTETFCDDEGNVYYYATEESNNEQGVVSLAKVDSVGTREQDDGVYDDDGNFYFYASEEVGEEERNPSAALKEIATTAAAVDTQRHSQDGFYDDDGNFYYYAPEQSTLSNASEAVARTVAAVNDSESPQGFHGNFYYYSTTKSVGGNPQIADEVVEVTGNDSNYDSATDDVESTLITNGSFQDRSFNGVQDTFSTSAEDIPNPLVSTIGTHRNGLLSATTRLSSFPIFEDELVIRDLFLRQSDVITLMNLFDFKHLIRLLSNCIVATKIDSPSNEKGNRRICMIVDRPNAASSTNILKVIDVCHHDDDQQDKDELRVLDLDNEDMTAEEAFMTIRDMKQDVEAILNPDAIFTLRREVLRCRELVKSCQQLNQLSNVAVDMDMEGM